MPDLFSLGYEGGESCGLISAKTMYKMGQANNGQWQDYHHTARDMHMSGGDEIKEGQDIFCLALDRPFEKDKMSYFGEVNFQFADLQGANLSDTGITSYEDSQGAVAGGALAAPNVTVNYQDTTNGYSFTRTPVIGSALQANLLTPRPDESNSGTVNPQTARTNY